MTSQRRAKRLKAEGERPGESTRFLQSLFNGGVSNAALTTLLNKLKRAPPDLLANYSDTAMSVAIESKYAVMKHTEVLTLRDGSTFDWEMCNPNQLLATMVEESPCLQRVYSEVARRKGNEPWSLVIGYDEYVPGSKFRCDTNRKAMSLSFNFLDPGLEALCHDEAWFMPVTIRAKVLANVEGGWSNRLRRYLNLQLLNPTGLATAGVPLYLNGSVYVLKARLVALLTDGDGHRQALQWRGHASVLPCFRHNNALRKN